MKRLILAFREAALRFSRDGCAFLAQAIAFNALFTVFPLLILVLSAASLFFPDAQCDPAGTLTIASKTHAAAVRIYAGARLPELVPAAEAQP